MDKNILEEELNALSEELQEAHKYLDKLGIPTNGVDAWGNLGYGKRENLSLVQRLSYVIKKETVK